MSSTTGTYVEKGFNKLSQKRLVNQTKMLSTSSGAVLLEQPESNKTEDLSIQLDKSHENFVKSNDYSSSQMITPMIDSKLFKKTQSIKPHPQKIKLSSNLNKDIQSSFENKRFITT